MEEQFEEAAAPHSTLVLLFARGVGVLVALAACSFAILLMMVIRSIIASVLGKVGVFGILALALGTVWATTKALGGLSAPRLALVWRLLSRSCS
jgi:hypothetical protein